MHERTSRSAVAQSGSSILRRSAQTGSLALEEPKLRCVLKRFSSSTAEEVQTHLTNTGVSESQDPF